VEGAEDFTTRDDVLKPPSSSPSNSPPILKKKRLNSRAIKLGPKTPTDGETQPSTFSDKLRARAVAELAELVGGGVNSEQNDVVLAAKEATSRDHANQDDILLKLRQAVAVDTQVKGANKRKTRTQKKKAANVDTSPLLKAFHSDEPPPPPPKAKAEEGEGKADVRPNCGWGKDGRHMSH
jgi:hypothetical protein